MRAQQLQAVAHGALATALCGLAMGLLLLPQRLLQRPQAQGVVSLHLAADGGLRLWNQPIASGELKRLLAAPSLRRRMLRLRIVPDPDTPWGDVRRLFDQLTPLPLSLELQLPAPPPSSG
ncbi:MAG: hypothetical protein WD136_01120 [Cyanobium sp.]